MHGLLAHHFHVCISGLAGGVLSHYDELHPRVSGVPITWGVAVKEDASGITPTCTISNSTDYMLKYRSVLMKDTLCTVPRDTEGPGNVPAGHLTP